MTFFDCVCFLLWFIKFCSGFAVELQRPFQGGSGVDGCYFYFKVDFCFFVLALRQSIGAAKCVFIFGETDEGDTEDAFVVGGIEIERK